MTEKELRNLIGKTETRTMTIERKTFDRAARTVELSFASETPCETWFGMEILDHSPGAGDMARLNSGGAVLLCHDRSQQCGGIVENTARIDSDRVSRATILFSRSKLGEDTMNDVEDGIRKTVSVRFQRLEMVLEKEEKDQLPIYRTTKWIGLEVSFEPIPADDSVGVGRTADNENDLATLRSQAAEILEALRKSAGNGARTETETPERTQSTVEETTPTTPANPPAPSPEIQRAADIIALGALTGMRDFAVELSLEEGMTVETARKKISEKRKASQTQTPTESPEAISHRTNGQDQLAYSTPRVSLRAFKGEKAQERAHRAGQFLLGHVLGNARARQWCADHGLRAHSEADNETGGLLVFPEFENVIIDLREEYGTFRRHANVVPMKGDKLTRPRRTGGLTAYPIGAKGASRKITESKKGWDAVNLEAKKVGVLAKYEDELSEDAAIGIADDLTDEASYAFTVFEDECGFLGDGTADFHGITGIIPKLESLDGTIANIAGIVVASGSGADKWAEITKNDTLKLMGRLPRYAYKRGAVWHCSNAFWSEVLLRIITDAGGATMHEMEGAHRPLYQGYPVEISQTLAQTPTTAQIPLLFGNIRAGVMLGDRRGVTMKQTDSNDDDFEHDLQCLKATERFDINVHDVGNASATAAQRKPGPIVALRTKAS